MKTINNTNNNTCTVDFAARKIVVTAAFAKSAGEYGSDAYNIMMGLRRDLPEFKIETLAEKKKSKEPVLTLDIMEAYIIRTYGAESDELKEFHTVLENSMVKKSKRYAAMQKLHRFEMSLQLTAVSRPIGTIRSTMSCWKTLN